MVDLGYTHIFFNDSQLNNVGTTGDNLKGSFEGEANLLALQLCLHLLSLNKSGGSFQLPDSGAGYSHHIKKPEAGFPASGFSI